MSALWTRIVSGVLFPAHEFVKGHDSVARRRQLEASQWWTPEQLEQHRLNALRRFLQQLVQRVPYYRERFRQLGLRPEGLGSVAELAAYPLLSKADIRANTEALKADGAGPLKRYNTGGSSGEPLVFYMGRDRISHDVAAKWRATRWWGVDIGDPETVVWGSPVELGAQDHLREWRDRLFRTTLLPAFEMSEANLDRFVASIRRTKPCMLFGYPSSLSLIATHARKRGTALNDLGIRVAFVTSERLYDHQRSTIEDVFGCPVANGYGSRDAGFIAHSCPHGSLHISAEDLIVEIVDAQGRVLPSGQSGEIVVTHLATGDFPMLRYRTGDIGTLSSEQCACKRCLPVLKDVQGRTTDFVVAHDGTIMHGLALIYVVRDLPGIAQFKVVQESLDRTVVQLVRGPQFEEPLVERIRAGMRQRLGDSVDVDVQLLDEIPAERSGKFRYVVSHVAAPA